MCEPMDLSESGISISIIYEALLGKWKWGLFKVNKEMIVQNLLIKLKTYIFKNTWGKLIDLRPSPRIKKG